MGALWHLKLSNPLSNTYKLVLHLKDIPFTFFLPNLPIFVVYEGI